MLLRKRRDLPDQTVTFRAYDDGNGLWAIGKCIRKKHFASGLFRPDSERTCCGRLPALKGRNSSTILLE